MLKFFRHLTEKEMVRILFLQKIFETLDAWKENLFNEDLIKTIQLDKEKCN